MIRTHATRQRLAALVLLGAGGCRQAEPAPPTPQLTATPAVVAAAQPVTFRWTGTDADCTLKTGVRVLEPDCRSGTATETYSAPGHYPVTLVITTAKGVTFTDTVRVRVTPDERGETPVDPPITPRDEVTFETSSDDLSVTFDASADAPEARFGWAFGDGTRGTGERVTHRYAHAGRYNVTLTVTTTTGKQQRRRTLEVGRASGERVTLFDGGDLSAWRLTRGGAPNWRIGDGFTEVVSGTRVSQNDIQTKEVFGDFRLHLEFRVPETPPGTPEQGRGNSGVYLQGRYEVQVLDSFNHPLAGKNDAGAVYGVADAAVNASRPAGTWQRYEIVFRAARFSGGKKTEPARVTVFWNDQKVQDDTRIPGPTRLGQTERGGNGVLTGPILLQDHGNPVQYRNIWLERL